eukprot:jgi/Tetstr1/420984/TSEL_012044.t1
MSDSSPPRQEGEDGGEEEHHGHAITVVAPLKKRLREARQQWVARAAAAEQGREEEVGEREGKDDDRQLEEGSGSEDEPCGRNVAIKRIRRSEAGEDEEDEGDEGDNDDGAGGAELEGGTEGLQADKELDEGEEGAGDGEEQEGSALHPQTTRPRVRQMDVLDPTLQVESELDIVAASLTAIAEKKYEELDGILADCLRILQSQPAAPPKYHFMSAVYISKLAPAAFALPQSFELLLEMLQTKGAAGSTLPSAKRTQVLALLAASLLQRSLDKAKAWPTELATAFMDDLFGPRFWAEHESAAELVANITTAFPNAAPADKEKREQLPVQTVVSTGTANEGLLRKARRDLSNVEPRYHNPVALRAVKDEFLGRLQSFVAATNARENIKNLMRILRLACCWPEGRAYAAAQMEGMLNNPSLFRSGQHILESLVASVSTTEPGDLAAVQSLVAMRLKPQHSQIFHRTLQTLCLAKPDYMQVALQYFCSQDLREKNKVQAMGCITSMARFSAAAAQVDAGGAGPAGEALPEGRFEQALGTCLKQAMANAETRPRMRDFTKRLLKATWPDMSICQLCRALLDEWEPIREHAQSVREAWLGEVMSTVCLLQLTATSQVVGECMAARPPVEVAKTPSGQKLLRSCSQVALDGMLWCHDTVRALLPELPPDRYVFVVRRLLFLQGDRYAYFTPGEQFGDVEAKALQVMQWEVPVLEDTLARLMFMGLVAESPLTPVDSLNLVEGLLRRMASQRLVVRSGAMPPPCATNPDLMDAIMRLSAMPAPVAPLPPPEDGEGAPEVSTPAVWWRAQLSVLLLGVLNMNSIGKEMAERLPSLRMLCESLMLRSTAFPAVGGEEAKQQFEADEAETARLDAQAAQQLVGHYRTMGLQWEPPAEGVYLLDVSPCARRPPESIFDELFRMDQAYNLGYYLRLCQDPPLFGRLLGSQTPSNAWHWLRGVLVNDPSALDALPRTWMPEVLVLLQADAQDPSLASLAPPPPELKMRAIQSIRRGILQAQPDSAQAKEAASSLECLAAGLASHSANIRASSQECLALVLLQDKPAATASATDGEGDPMESAPSGPQASAGQSTSTAAVSGSEANGGGSVCEAAEPEKETPLRGDAGDWLLALPELPAAAVLVSAITPHVAAALQVEDQPRALVPYLRFLALHAPPIPSPSSPAAAVGRLLASKPLTTRWLLSQSPMLAAAALTVLSEALTCGCSETAELAAAPEGGEADQLVWMERPGHEGRTCLPHSVVRTAMALLGAVADGPAAPAEAGGEQDGSNAEVPALCQALCQQMLVRQEAGGWAACRLVAAGGAAPGTAVPLLSGAECLSLAGCRDPALAVLAVGSLGGPADMLRALRSASLAPAASAALLARLDDLPGAGLGAQLAPGWTARWGPRHAAAAVAAAQARLLASQPAASSPPAGTAFLAALRSLSPELRAGGSTGDRVPMDVDGGGGGGAISGSGSGSRAGAAAAAPGGPSLTGAGRPSAEPFCTPGDAKAAVRWLFHGEGGSGSGASSPPGAYWRLRRALQRAAACTARRGSAAAEGGWLAALSTALAAEGGSPVPAGRAPFAVPLAAQLRAARMGPPGGAEGLAGALVGPPEGPAEGAAERWEDAPLDRLRPALLGALREAAAEKGGSVALAERLAAGLAESSVQAPPGRGAGLLVEALVAADPELQATQLPPLSGAAAAALTTHALHSAGGLARARLLGALLAGSGAGAGQPGAVRMVLDAIEAAAGCPAAATPRRGLALDAAGACRLGELVAAEHRHGGGQPSGRPTPRLPPLLVAVGGQPELLRPLVAHLLSAPAEGPAAAPAPGWGDACADVVQQLYLALPGAVGDAVQQVLGAGGPGDGSGGGCAAQARARWVLCGGLHMDGSRTSSALSALCHMLCGRIAAGTAPEKEADSTAALLLARDLALQHPATLLLHLPGLLGGLQPALRALGGGGGSVEVRGAVMRTATRLLGLLDTLKATLLAPDAPQRKAADVALGMALATYLELSQRLRGGMRSEPAAVACIARMADFLCGCMAAGGRAAGLLLAQLDRLSALEPKEKRFEARLPQAFPTVPKLAALREMVAAWREGCARPGALPGAGAPEALPRGVWQHVRDAGKQLAGALHVESAAQRVVDAGVMQAHGRLDAGLQALPVGQLVADIEQVGRRMPRLLLPMLPSILQLTGCGDGSLRRQAYKLLKVVAEDVPSDAAVESIGSNLLSQLQSGDSEVVSSACQAAGDFLPLCFNHKRELLRELLRLGHASELAHWQRLRPHDGGKRS